MNDSFEAKDHLKAVDNDWLNTLIRYFKLFAFLVTYQDISSQSTRMARNLGVASLCWYFPPSTQSMYAYMFIQGRLKIDKENESLFMRHVTHQASA